MLSTGAGVVLLVVAVLPVELVCVSMDAGLPFFTIHTFSSERNEQQLRLTTYIQTVSGIPARE